jgi:hypothetical protein
MAVEEQKNGKYGKNGKWQWQLKNRPQEVQQRRADNMLKATSSRHGIVEVGTTVRIPIDSVDRGKIDPRNLLGVVMERSDDGLYKIGTEQGRILT